MCCGLLDALIMADQFGTQDDESMIKRSFARSRALQCLPLGREDKCSPISQQGGAPRQRFDLRIMGRLVAVRSCRNQHR